MKFHRKLNEQETRELAEMDRSVREISGGFISLKTQTAALQKQQLENLREAVAIQARVKMGDPEATGRNASIVSANETIETRLAALGNDSERLTKSSTTKLFSMWGRISVLGEEMEVATRERIALELRSHFTRQDEAEYLAGQTQTIRDIIFHFEKDRVPFGQIQYGWEDGQCEIALGIVARMIHALLNGGDVVPDVTPFAITEPQESETREASVDAARKEAA